MTNLLTYRRDGEEGKKMSVYDFCGLCTDESVDVSIYDMNEEVEEEVFAGSMRGAMESEWADFEVDSFDLTPDGLCLNIDTSEG